MRIRTGYSFRQAVGKLEDVIERLKLCKYPVAPISDRSSTFGFNRWNNICIKEQLRPIFGVEIAVCESIEEKKPIFDYWTFFAKDNLKDLNNLFSIATDQFRYRPVITYSQANNANLLKIIGNKSRLDLVFSDENTFVALSPSCSKGYIKKAKNLGLNFIFSSDNYFPSENDIGLYEVICGRNSNIQTWPQFIQTEEEWIESVSRIAEGSTIDAALSNALSLSGRSTAMLEKARLVEPTRDMSLLEMCLKGSKELGVDLENSVYASRLERELKLIKEKEFEDYFYIIADICNFARKEMVVGPARGSSCGSLVCYLLGITTIDPIPYGLIFERFIDINRKDLPDIDIDFSDQQRSKVFDYIKEKYGEDHVARLGTVSLYKPRSAINEAGAALRIPKWKCEAALDSLVEHSSGDARAFQSIEDTFQQTTAGKELISEFPEMLISAKMEGHPRHYSQHAAGIVITQKPINHFVAVDNRTGSTQCDKKDAEDLNLLKIDALGLTQLSIIEDTIKLANLPKDILNRIPLNDKEAFDVLNRQKFSGIFQFNGLSIQTAVKQCKIEFIDDIICITALARPGPLASGGANEWILRRVGKSPVTYPHSVFEPYLKDTLGIVIYQEQVMEIGRNVGDLSWEDVSALRKAMSKSLGKEYFNKFGDPWKKAAIEKGVSLEDAEKIWDDLCAYGSWSFNKSHAVAYGTISYWCLWLKAHYPFEFCAATLSHEFDPKRQIELLRELDQEGIKYVPVDMKKSTDKWVVGEKDEEKFLVGPLTNVKGIGPKTVTEILRQRREGNGELKGTVAKKLINPKTPIDSLYPIKDAFKRIMPDPRTRNIWTEPVEIIKIDNRYDGKEVLVFCVLTKINPRHENEAILIAKRGFERNKNEPLDSLNLFLADDTDTMFGKITRWDFNKLGKSIVDRGRPGKCLYVIKGTIKINVTFRMMLIKAVRYIGDIESKTELKTYNFEEETKTVTGKVS